jgi:hypothetical protein
MVKRSSEKESKDMEGISDDNFKLFSNRSEVDSHDSPDNSEHFQGSIGKEI